MVDKLTWSLSTISLFEKPCRSNWYTFLRRSSICSFNAVIFCSCFLRFSAYVEEPLELFSSLLKFQTPFLDIFLSIHEDPNNTYHQMNMFYLLSFADELVYHN